MHGGECGVEMAMRERPEQERRGGARRCGGVQPESSARACEQCEEQPGGEREWAERKRREAKQDGFELVAVIGAGRASGQGSSSLGRGG